jgi:small ubiquitin-related modifier
MADDEKDSEQLNLKVVGQDGQVVQFKIKQNTPLRKLMNAYCDRAKLVQNTVRFTFDGSRINDNDTPKTMDMEDNDTIEVFMQQTGGRQIHHSRWPRFVSSDLHNYLRLRPAIT